MALCGYRTKWHFLDYDTTEARVGLFPEKEWQYSAKCRVEGTEAGP